MGHMFLQLLSWEDFPDYPVTTLVNRQITQYLIYLVKYLISHSMTK